MNAPQLQFLMLTFAGWVNRTQQNVIEYLQEENRGLRKQLGGKRLRFTDRQRRRFAAKAIGRKGLFANPPGAGSWDSQPFRPERPCSPQADL